VGTSFVNMTNKNTTFCYLSRVNVENTDTTNESAECRVFRRLAPFTTWRLEATLGGGGGPDADVRCSAICYNN
jgi:hypothetical protein